MNRLASRQTLSLLATLCVAIALAIGASIRYEGFASLDVAVNLLEDNAFLGVAAVGMTFVILSGGIDLSVGSVVGLTSIVSALLMEKAQFHPLATIPMVLAMGAFFGTFMGYLIVAFGLAPFLVTLAGMFFARGLAYTLSLESIPLTHPFFTWLSSQRLPLGEVSIPPMTILFLIVIALGIYLAGWTRFGRSVYAFGGNPNSAKLMGLSTGRTQILVYALSGLLAALAGVVYTFYTASGNATAAFALELDAIAAVVIGGTLLTGGRGGVFGTFIGVLILGMIQTIITFESTLNSWWTKIIIGALLFIFVVFQQGLSAVSHKRMSLGGGSSPRRTRAPNPSSAAKIGVGAAWAGAILLFAAQSVSAATPATLCASGYGGRHLGGGLYQLTGTFLKPGQRTFDVDEIPDPAPPYVNERGEVEIYGSATYFIRYKNWSEFENGGCYEVVKLDLYNPNYVKFAKIYTHPWDLRKFRIEEGGKTKTEVLMGGAMSPTKGREAPEWPEDNPNRRIFFFRPDEQGRWLRDALPVVGTIGSGWIGHSYGGNLIQENIREANIVRTDAPGSIAFFYERVPHVVGGGPHKTEIFAKKMKKYDQAVEKETPIVLLGKNPFPATKRTIGGYLVEGPRPVQVRVGGRSFYFIGFSSGDFPTDSYTINFAWSDRLLGPYHPVLTRDGKDLRDFGKELKAHFGLSWVGRPSVFRTPGGGYEMLFHGVMKSVLPDNDYTRWPQQYQLWEFFRCLFKVPVKFQLNSRGEPVIDIDVSPFSGKPAVLDPVAG